MAGTGERVEQSTAGSSGVRAVKVQKRFNRPATRSTDRLVTERNPQDCWPRLEVPARIEIEYTLMYTGKSYSNDQTIQERLHYPYGDMSNAPIWVEHQIDHCQPAHLHRRKNATVGGVGSMQ